MGIEIPRPRHANDQGGENILWKGLEDGKEHVFTVDPYTSVWRRPAVGFLGTLPIQSRS